MKRWYVVHTHANAEARAAAHLARQGFDVWLPRYRKKRRHARRTEMVLRPLFPRYLFAHVDLEAEHWRPILSTAGVSHLIGEGEGPSAVADDVIAALKARAGDDELFDLTELTPLRHGDRVRISAGPLADLDGIFQARTDAERVTVLLRLMGREVRATVRAEDVETR